MYMSHNREFFRFFLISLKESFLGMVPYLLLLSSLILVLQFFRFFSLPNDVFYYQFLFNITVILQQLFPILLLISLSYNIAKILSFNKFISVMIAICSYFVILSFENDNYLSTPFFETATTLNIILVPLFSSYFLYSFSKLIKNNELVVLPNIHENFNYFLPLIFTLFCTIFFKITFILSF